MIILLLLALAIRIVCQPNLPPQEFSALHDLYLSTNGANWKWRRELAVRWNFGPIIPHNPCFQNWQGLACTCTNSSQTHLGYFYDDIIEPPTPQECHVDKIFLAGYGMIGELPSSIMNLTYLSHIHLNSNKLHGTIPSGLFNLSHLEFLNLGSNKFNGSIPRQIFLASNLIEIDLSENLLTGPIPRELSYLSKLETIMMNINVLTNTIPDIFGNLSHLNSLQLSNNYFHGSMPASIALLNATLQHLILPSNYLSGPLPNWLSNLTAVQTLTLSSNRFTGTIPKILSGLTNVSGLHLNNNHFTSTLPSELALLTQLSSFSINNNRLNGSLPQEYGDMKSINILLLSNNRLTGTIPDSWFKLPQVTEIDIEFNFINGTIPTSIGFATSLFDLLLNNNNLTGTLPTELGLLSDSMLFLYLSNNSISGTIPIELRLMTNLFVINLSGNELTGTIPEEIGEIQSLGLLYLYSNNLNGTIPSVLSNLTNLNTFILSDNSLTGILSPKFGNMSSSLKLFDVGANLLTGIIPEELGKLTRLTTLQLYQNLFTSTIPSSLSRITAINVLEMNSNLLTGILPSNLGASNGLSYLVINDNYLEGTIPTSFGMFYSMWMLDLNSNQLTGTIPPQLLQLMNMEYLILHNNELVGPMTCPVTDSGINMLVLLDLHNNYLTSSIPSGISNASRLFYMDLSYNTMTGPLPLSIGLLPLLQTLLLNDNFFCGPIQNVFTHKQRKLLSIDLSDNSFTGHLSFANMSIQALQSFAAVSNCITGSLPFQLCNASSLVSLALDGLSAAAVCQNRLFRNNPTLKSYELSSFLTGGLPSCLFSLPNIRTLHLSGNGISGYIDSGIIFSSSLMDLSLSHNRLTGTIPQHVQDRAWDNLDLSFNMLYGKLLSSMPMVSEGSSLYLEVNRLSGQVPSSLHNAKTISVLSGNLFGCDYNRKTLPSQDANINTYECGSSSFELSLIAWSFFVFISTVMTIAAVLWLSSIDRHQDMEDENSIKNGAYVKMSSASLVHRDSMSWMSCMVECREKVFHWWHMSTANNGSAPNVVEFSNILAAIRTLSIIITGFAVFVMVPIFATLTHFYNTYEIEYAWSVSAAFLSGVAPAVVLLIVLIAFLVAVVVLSRYLLLGFYHNIVNCASNEDTNMNLTAQHIAYLSLVLLFNCTIVFFVNVGYILATLNFNQSIVSMCQLALAGFKIIWSDVVTRRMVKMAKKIYMKAFTESDSTHHQLLIFKSRDVLFQVFLALFNNIAIPCAATAAVSSNCFFNALVTPQAVSSSYQSFMVLIVFQATNGAFESTTVASTHSTSFVPPFMYSYQCSSMMLTSYSSVFVYMFIMIAFGSPLFMTVLKMLHMRSKPDDLVHRTVSVLLPSLLIPVDDQRHDLATADAVYSTIFDEDNFIAGILTYFTVLMTFGVMFPPVAVVVCVGICSHCCVTQLLIGRYRANTSPHGVGNNLTASAVTSITDVGILTSFSKLSAHKSDSQLLTLLHKLNDDCGGAVVPLMQSLWLLVWFAGIFYSFFLFDILGNSEIFPKSMWAGIVMLTTPPLVLCCVVIYDKAHQISHK